MTSTKSLIPARWNILTICKIGILMLIAILFWVLFGPLILIYKLVETMLQPYLLRKQCKEWDEMYQECLKQGIHIDYPPTRGSLMKELPLKWLFDDEDEDF